MVRKFILIAAVSIVGIGAERLIGAQEAGTPKSLEERVLILEKKWEGSPETGDETRAVVTIGKDGFAIKAADGSFQLRIGGTIQSDYRAYLSDVNQTGVNQFLLRRVRPILEGTVNRIVDFRLVPDFGGGAAVIQDAYLDVKALPGLKLRSGKFKPYVGLEQLQSDSFLAFVERGLPSDLVPQRSVGAQLIEDLWKGAVNLAAGVFDGTTNSANVDGDTGDEKEYVGRIWVQPFKNTFWEALQQFGLGISGTSGKRLGTLTTANLPTYKTEGQESFFGYNSTTFANGKRSRISPQGYWYTGPFGLLGEYVASSQEVTNVAATRTSTKLTDTAWQITASYVITGENATYKGVEPRRGVDEHGPGAWEIAARYSELRTDPNSFSLYADPTKSASRAQSWTAGVNWYLTSRLKAVANYENVRFAQGGAGNTDRPREQAILSRFQVVF